MIKATLLLLSLFLFPAYVTCQEDNYSIALPINTDNFSETIVTNKSGYYYYPDSVLGHSIKYIRRVHALDSGEIDTQTITFYWASGCNDGSFNLNITPRQISLTSGHDNPNPNYLFWVIPCDSLFHHKLKLALYQKVPTGFQSTYLPLHFFDSTYNSMNQYMGESEAAQDSFWQACDVEMEGQLIRYFNLMNRLVHDDKSKALPPTKAFRESFTPKCLESCLTILTMPIDDRIIEIEIKE